MGLEAVSKRNMQKFFEDYPQHAVKQDEVMQRFHEVSNRHGIVNKRENIVYALGDLFKPFCKAHAEGQEHTLIIMQDYLKPAAD